ncbi:MAG: GAF domain-containing protein [Nitrospinaceae bacterium]|jgi:HD-GYP domain-containing protein (c-di-GMP phosphodiesterase class II)|nr:GAF domain-containing protein [Nitrospinaceae bacterium]MBT3435326.1 GAF domain-containing protein [Nitrospinaceae bacterium]MBT3820613.1 GAF domain-containing protein [Nitrospinaceae bacterium]MBT4094779.1 GAF domain-containing protein [Nitrospinaceae bacterium]MBT4432080.1 GAF domain-containing protein [Nitrospinaceae bacterium]
MTTDPQSTSSNTADLIDHQLSKTVFHPSSIAIDGWKEHFKDNDIALVSFESISEIHPTATSMNVILVDGDLHQESELAQLKELSSKENISIAAIIVESPGNGTARDENNDLFAGYLNKPLSTGSLIVSLRAAFQHSAYRLASHREYNHRITISKNLENLTQIGIALSAEQNNGRLLDLILTRSRELTNADAGSLYLVEETPDGEKSLRFKHTQNDSKKIPFKEFVMPATKASISGYVAVTGEALNIQDVYQIPEGVEYSFNQSFDQSVGYRSMSMLVAPMTDHKNEIIGVLQLINAKKSPDILLTDPAKAEKDIVPFESAIQQIIQSLASQAAVALENTLLLESIERTFEGLVTASVHAIESRDPATSGHSERVTELTCALAEAVSKTKSGQYAEVEYTEEQMKELRYAGLLHDFGKIGVRESVLVKANKLYPLELEVVKNRFSIIKRTIQCEYQEKMIQTALAGDKKRTEELQHQLDTHLEEVDKHIELVLRADIPTMMPDGQFDELLEMGKKTYTDFDGTLVPYLTDHEMKCLILQKGNLTDSEFAEIQSHVSHSYNFLVEIPWTKDLRGVPEIAHGHHEKLNGEGYPRKLHDEEIVLQAKMMCVCDIFDALTASDRPYKKAAPLERAIQILNFEVKDNHLCPELVDIFIRDKVYQVVDAFEDVEYSPEK